MPPWLYHSQPHSLFYRRFTRRISGNIFNSLYPLSTLDPSMGRSSFSESLLEESIQSAESVIGKWTPTDSKDVIPSSPFSYCSLLLLFTSSSHEEALQYINAVLSLHKAIKRFIALNKGSDQLVRAQNLLENAIKYMEKEFCRILKWKRECLDSESVSTCSSGVSISSYQTTSVSGSDSESDSRHTVFDDARIQESSTDEDAVRDLKLIVECMISVGYEKKCVQIYKRIRRSIVDEQLKNLSVERLSSSQIQKMEWVSLEMKIKTWLRAARSATKIFCGERTLCDHVFSSSNSIIESCFAEIVRDEALNLFSFPERVSKCMKSPEKIFRTLDLHEAISDLMPQIESIFNLSATATVRLQVCESLSKLGAAVRSMLVEFESSIRNESSKVPLPGCGVHPLARYVMNYLAFLSEYSASIADIFADSPFALSAPLPDSLFCDENSTDGVGSSPTAVLIAWQILLLLCKIDGKAQLYDDVAQSYLFLANNLQYTLVKVQESNLGLLLGRRWMVKHEERLRHYAARYEEVAWGRVLKSVAAEIPRDGNAEEYFENFNVSFREAYMRQTSWVIPCRKLRDEIKVSIARKIIPVYGKSYEKYYGSGMRKRSLTLTPEDLGNCLSDLFFENGGGGMQASICNQVAYI